MKSLFFNKINFLFEADKGGTGSPSEGEAPTDNPEAPPAKSESETLYPDKDEKAPDEKPDEKNEGEEKKDLVKMIANHMKKSYLTWNREAVSNEEIFGDLKTLSGGKLELDPELELSETRDILAKNVRKTRGKAEHGDSIGRSRKPSGKKK